jgi:CubicO group peptidase (beta-lactamase class C family)
MSALKKSLSVFGLLALMLAGTTGLAQRKAPAATKVDLAQLDAYFEKAQKDWDIPGMSIGIVKDGQLIFSKGYGVKELGKNERPDGKTLYAIASNTKAFTASVMATLVQEGKLNWRDKVRQHLPYFSLYDPYVSQEANLVDLLTHRVGLGTFSGDIIWYKSRYRAEEVVKKLKGVPKAFDFRDGYGYSNVMYVTAGEVIRSVTGKSWGENIRERFLVPLGMERTIYSLKNLEAKGNVATPHLRYNEQNKPIAWVDWEEIGALGGLISCVDDMAKWMVFQMNHGVVGKDTLLTPASRNMLWQIHNSFPVNLANPDDFNTHFRGYGLGWNISDYRGKMRVGHTGGYDGMITAFTMLPEEKLGVIVLTNGMQSPIMPLTYQVFDAFLGVKGSDWSAEMLARRKKYDQQDDRVASRIAARVTGTQPSVPTSQYVGTYQTQIYGDLKVSLEGDKLRLIFEDAPDLNATLEHWHYDVWKINWDKDQAWFDFGTVRFVTNNNLRVTGMEFDVPNDDIFFEELMVTKVE